MPITRKFKFGGGKRDGRADLDSIDTGFQHLDIGGASGCTERSDSVLGNNLIETLMQTYSSSGDLHSPPDVVKELYNVI